MKIVKKHKLWFKESYDRGNTKRQGFVFCLFKTLFLAKLNKQMPSLLSTYDALSLGSHKAEHHLVWLPKC